MEEVLLIISEQHVNRNITEISSDIRPVLKGKLYQKTFFHNKEMQCFRLLLNEEEVFADTNYFIGVDWLEIKRAAIYIEPKLNDSQQVNFLGMLMESLEATENLNHIDGLFHADFDQPWITIPQQKDLLSPVLIVQFLKLAQKIVSKGLKKSYYRITQNLNCRVKGKIPVCQQVKENVAKNRLTNTVCNFQEFGINSAENQFLKLILEFVSSYLSQKNLFFSKEQNEQLKNILNYCLPAFEHVDVYKNKHQRICHRKNVFYKEYVNAIQIGEYILKRFSFNVSKISQTQTHIPPFWIDMSKLFELYVFGKLKREFPEVGAITYHDSYLGGKETDILIRKEGYKCVIDCKYKPQYENNTPSLEDKRQLAGYTRLKSVYSKLDIQQNQIVRGLIIYSNQKLSEELKKENLFREEIGEYVEFYKIGIKLPDIVQRY